ncbi:Response regulator receiver domain protein [uncultured Eubacteriales bacterium]|uniref:Stage 0 sporulation protein A homolog n=1 Tax=uncultured Eubacteriales bacterium TaxID=172733 RepID=A0A212JC76_9FIRM|nr:Response regulator receiver domain protein [uncultured Eubacteriales bacterium]
MVRNVAIVEDTQAEADLLKEFLARYSRERDVEFTVTHFKSGELFLEKYRPVYDIVLMDIGLPKINGMEAAARLRELDETTTLIFITNMAQFAVRGYEVDAFDFVVKPVSYSNFALKLQRALTKLISRKETEVIVSVADGMYRIPSSQIKYIEISGHKMIYHTTGDTIRAYGNLKEVEAILNGKQFVRCNSCYLVNLHYVYAIRAYTVVVDGEELQISRPRKKAFVQALNDYLGGVI